MTTRFIGTDHDKAMFIKFIEQQALGFSVTTTRGKKRSVEQNRVQRLWCNEIAEQLGDRTAEEVRGYCKLCLGVPLMRAENEEFCQTYDTVIRPLPYEQKLALMMVPLDLPVTRIMNTKQKAAYLTSIQQHFADQGVVLTDPEALRYGDAA